MENITTKKIYEVIDIPQKNPCNNCNSCLRLRMMELGVIKGERIRVIDHKFGIFIIEILNNNNTTQSILALREDEFERICLKGD